MKLGVVIDPINQLNPQKDSTVAMLRAAARDGITLYAMTQQDLFLDAGQPMAKMMHIDVSADNDWYNIKSQSVSKLSELDVILMRKDPPFDMNYIYSTYLLELAEQQGVLVINKPQSLRDANEKYFTAWFPELCPTTLISQDKSCLKQFWQTHQDVIYKPLDGMGGQSIFHIDSSGRNLSVVLDTLTNNQTTPIMAQKYIPEIKTQGDKRILIIDDYIVPYTLARIPQGGDERGNLAQGALGKVAAITSHERQIASALMPSLQAKGLFFVGLDIIGDYLTEINVTSPTCIVEIEQASGEAIADKIIEKIKRKLKDKS